MKPTVQVTEVADFTEWLDLSSYKLEKFNHRPYLSNMVKITARKGCFTLKYKESLIVMKPILTGNRKVVLKIKSFHSSKNKRVLEEFHKK